MGPPQRLGMSSKLFSVMQKVYHSLQAKNRLRLFRVVQHWKNSEAQLSKEMIACRGGIVRVPNVKYNAKQLSLQPRLAWRGAMQVHLQGYLPYICRDKQTFELLWLA
jgi:hypothetical protein